MVGVEEKDARRGIESVVKDENNEVKVDDGGKIVGWWKGVGKEGVGGCDGVDGDGMKGGVGLCEVIEKEFGGKRDKVSCKVMSEMLGGVVEGYEGWEIEVVRERGGDKGIDG